MTDPKKHRGRALATAAVLAVTAAILLMPSLDAAHTGAAAMTDQNAMHIATTHKVFPTCATGVSPAGIAFDPISKWFYVADSGSHEISVYKSTCTNVGNITLAANAAPIGVAFDPANNEIFVTDESLALVYVINKMTVNYTITGSQFVDPYAITYDPATGFFQGAGVMAVTNLGNDSVSVLAQYSATSKSFLWYSFPVGQDPIAITYSPVYDSLFIANYHSNNVTVYDATSLALKTASIPVGTGPAGIAYDPATLETYVTNYGSNNLTVIDAYGVLVSSIAVGHNPYGLAYDPVNLRLYVTSFTGHSVFEVAQNNSVVKIVDLATGTKPIGIDFDASDNEMITTLYQSDHVSVLS
jgi:YVTN family beta-propeller protein